MATSQHISGSDAATHGALGAGEIRLSPGHRIGRYTIIDLVGVGGMGCVYRAQDSQLSRVVALKVLRRHGRDGDDSGRLRLLREGQAMARLSHPNVVPVYGVDSAEGMVFIAMEYVQGATLREWLVTKTRTWSEVLTAMLQAGEGLAAAHAEGIIHRDFKPGNVLVGADGRARVMDFGLARGQHSATGAVTPLGADVTSAEFLASQPITKAGAVVGTPAYMAPEQHFGRTADAKSDQFAFCVSLYEGLYNRRPFVESKGFRGLARAKDRGEILRPPRNSKVPRWLRAAVLRGLSARKVDRWPSLHAMLVALRRKRRRRIPVAVASLGVGTAVAAGLGLGLLGDDRCSAGQAAFDAVWTADQRRDVHAGVSASKRGHAAVTAERTVVGLDAWASTWLAGHAEACAAPADERGTRVLACLARQRAAFAATTQTLTDSGDALADSALKIVSGLPRPSDCLTDDAMPDVAAAPEAIAADVDVVWTELAQARVLEVAGHFEDGEPVAAAALAKAETLAYEPLLAEALRLHGNLLERIGKRESAAVTLERAYVVAVSVGDSRVAALSAMRLVMVHADGLFLTDAAQRWLDELRTRVARLGPDPRPKIWLAQAEGTVAMARSEYGAAADAFADGLAVFDALPDPDPVRRGTLLHNLGLAYYKAGRLDQARETLSEAVGVQHDTLGPLHPSVATSLMALAGVRYGAGDTEAAMAIAQDALDLQRRTLGDQHPTLASGLANLAGLLVDVGQADKATVLLREALAIWEAVDEPSEMSAFEIGNLAQLLLSVEVPDEAEPVARRALRLKIDLFSEQHEEVATARLLLGEVLFARGQGDAAQQEFAHALRVFELSVGPNHPHVATALIHLARTQTQAQPAQAKAAYTRAATVAEHNRRWQQAGDAHFALARLLGRGDRRAARQRAQAAVAAYDRAQGDQSGRRDKVQAWLTDLG